MSQCHAGIVTELLLQDRRRPPDGGALSREQARFEVGSSWWMMQLRHSEETRRLNRLQAGGEPMPDLPGVVEGEAEAAYNWAVET